MNQRKFWISSEAEEGRFTIGEGDVVLATGLDRDTAHLLARAPELFAALEGVARRHSWNPEGGGVCACPEHKAAASVLERARGIYRGIV